MKGSHKQDVGLEKPNTKRYKPYTSIYIKSKTGRLHDGVPSEDKCPFGEGKEVVMGGSLRKRLEGLQHSTAYIMVN